MANRWADWFRQAESDLTHARQSLEVGHHEWACFAAQQAAEKALKAVHGARGKKAWGHSVIELLGSLAPDKPAIDDVMLDRGRALDTLYIATRDPNRVPSGAPADYYTRAEADRAIGDAEAIVEWCRGMLPR